MVLGSGRAEYQVTLVSPTEMCSGSEAGSYLRLIDVVYHSTLGLRVIKKKRERPAGSGQERGVSPTSSSLLLSSLELSDTKVYDPYMRAILGTARSVRHI